jgi:periplasmic divalent cation tolerance protein
MSHSPSVIALTTMPAESNAEILARTLVERRLAACVNVLAPMQSIYRWHGAVEQTAERQLLIKTTADRLADLKLAIAELHPYEVPELLILSVADGGDAYLQWMRESVGLP